MCSETAPPRLSFSHDLSDLQDDVRRKDTLLLESNNDFEFSTGSTTFEFESSSADELFSNGVILPIQMQERTTTTRKHTRHGEPPYMKLPPRPSSSSLDKLVKRENKREASDVNGYEKKTHQSKSFWGFGRSKSLNCDTKKSFICSLPPLPRSNSTGSVSNPKRASSNKHQSAVKALSSSSSRSSCSAVNLYPVPKSPSGKGYGGSYANGLRISHVLDVPTPCISKGSGNLFGFGSFLRVGKVKKSKN